MGMGPRASLQSAPIGARLGIPKPFPLILLDHLHGPHIPLPPYRPATVVGLWSSPLPEFVWIKGGFNVDWAYANYIIGNETGDPRARG
jgi:hypothetical protein